MTLESSKLKYSFGIHTQFNLVSIVMKPVSEIIRVEILKTVLHVKLRFILKNLFDVSMYLKRESLTRLPVVKQDKSNSMI